MADTREKLIKLTNDVLKNLPWGQIASDTAEQIADYLLANGALLLPCNIGDMVYVITYCRCGNPECYDNQHCYKKETKRTPTVIASVMVQQKGRKYQWKDFQHRHWEWTACGTICYRVYQKPFELKMLTEVGKTVFLSLKEAEKALEERRKQ